MNLESSRKKVGICHLGFGFGILDFHKVEMVTIKKEDLKSLPLQLLIEINRLLEPIEWEHKEFLNKLKEELIKSNLSTRMGSEETFSFLPEIELLGDRFKEKEKRSLLKVSEIGRIFSPFGKLSRGLNSYEYRKEQEEMAKAVANAINQEKYLVVEAGTGVGKSWAYLIPAIFWAKKNNQHFIISTNTKNLQEQLMQKDIPFLKSCLGIDFSTAILKGRNNYPCLRKLASFLEEVEENLSLLLSFEERIFLVYLLIWLAKTESGDVEEAVYFRQDPSLWTLWDEISSEYTSCLGSECPYYRRCFVTRARQKAMEAEIVIVNHSLLFTDLLAEKHFFPSYSHIVFDEAHNLERVATTHLAVEVSYWMLIRLLNKIYRKEENIERGILVKVANKEKKLAKRLTPIIKSIPEVRRACKDFFKILEENSDLFPFDELTDKLRLRENSPGHNFLREQILELLSVWNQFFHRFGELAEEIEDSILAKDVKGKVKDGLQIAMSLNFLREVNDPNFVYWLEREKKEIRICAAPLEVGTYLNNILYSQILSLIFSSATLTVKGSFDFFKKRLGLDSLPKEKVSFLLLGSPFDYERQVLVNIASFLPSPQDEEEYTSQLVKTLTKILETVKGKSLILFTSHKMLNEVYQEIKPHLQMKFQILAQGIDGPRTIITDRFREDLNSILLGTHSFWEGVDLPGRTLECLILTRLPFAVPTEPIEEARVELIQKTGLDGFQEYSLPSAVIRLRQGIGRLIRSKTDKGIIILLDKRIITRNYGKNFLHSLPVKSYHSHRNEESLLNDIENWLR
jgi:ATP-dependent DNA helicase DinG